MSEKYRSKIHLKIENFLGIRLELKKLPPAYGIGKFMATMHLYKTDQYLETYQSNPQLNTGDYLNVGEYFKFRNLKILEYFGHCY